MLSQDTRRESRCCPGRLKVRGLRLPLPSNQPSGPARQASLPGWPHLGVLPKCPRSVRRLRRYHAHPGQQPLFGWLQVTSNLAVPVKARPQSASRGLRTMPRAAESSRRRFFHHLQGSCGDEPRGQSKTGPGLQGRIHGVSARVIPATGHFLRASTGAGCTARTRTAGKGWWIPRPG